MIKPTPRISQRDVIISYLRGTGRELSSAQAQRWFGVKNLRARISEISDLGLRVRTRVNSQGRTAYRISARDVLGHRYLILGVISRLRSSFYPSISGEQENS